MNAVAVLLELVVLESDLVGTGCIGAGLGPTNLSVGSDNMVPALAIDSIDSTLLYPNVLVGSPGWMHHTSHRRWNGNWVHWTSPTMIVGASCCGIGLRRNLSCCPCPIGKIRTYLDVGMLFPFGVPWRRCP